MFLFKKKPVPSIRTFIKSYLVDEVIVSDEKILDEYGRRYMRNWRTSCIAKKGDSILRALRDMRQNSVIDEVDRKHYVSDTNPFGHDEIFYTLNANQYEVPTVKGYVTS